MYIGMDRVQYKDSNPVRVNHYLCHVILFYESFSPNYITRYSLSFQNELEIQLKSEIILTKLLREKLCSNELELERFQADLASSIRVHDVLQTEIQRMQDELSYLTHKTTDMELQVYLLSPIYTFTSIYLFTISLVHAHYGKLTWSFRFQ